MDAADVTLTVLTATMVVLVAVGAGIGARRGGENVECARVVGGAVFVALAAWLGLVAALSAFGVFSNWAARPPRWPLLPLSAFVAVALVTRTAKAKHVLASLPPEWIVGAQTFRIFVEVALYLSFVAGRVPQQITFEGRNFDVVVGLSAPIVALLIAKGRIGAKGIVAWNVGGLAVLANTVATVATSTPGPLQRAWPGAPLTAIASWPVVWLPAFLMPLAVFFHVASLRRNVARLRASTH